MQPLISKIILSTITINMIALHFWDVEMMNCHLKEFLWCDYPCNLSCSVHVESYSTILAVLTIPTVKIR
jgi:hypothetical protein